MVSFSPYKLSAGLAKATGIHRVFGSRVSKPAPISPRSSPSRKAATWLPTPRSNPSPTGALISPESSHKIKEEDIDELSNDYEPLDNDVFEEDEVLQIIRGDMEERVIGQRRVIGHGAEASNLSPAAGDELSGDELNYDFDNEYDEDDDDSITEMASVVLGGAVGIDYEDQLLDSIEEDDEDETESEFDSDEGDDVEEPDYSWPVDEKTDEGYKETLTDVPGYDNWPVQMQRLHKLMSLKGKHPLMPLSWARDLVDNPVWPDLFAPQDSDKAVLLHNNSSQFRATKALRALFELQGRIRGYRAIRRPDLTGRTIERELRRYIKWAWKDAGLDRHDLEMNIRILRYNANAAPSSVAQDVNRRLKSWAKEYRRNNRERGIRHYPRVLYAFAIIQHTVSILTIDARERSPNPIVFDDYDFSVVQGWLDSGLGVAIPINYAREALVAYRDHFGEVQGEASDDPDA